MLFSSINNIGKLFHLYFKLEKYKSNIYNFSHIYFKKFVIDHKTARVVIRYQILINSNKIVYVHIPAYHIIN